MFTKEIATALGCDPKNINDVEITETTVDSRSVTAPASALFFALRGVNHDGHDYIPALYARGCRNFVVGAWRVEFDALTGANFFRVLDVRAALQSLAAWRRSRLRADVVAVTGSNGKTIVKEWIYQLLASEPGIYRSPRSYNSQIGVPLSVLGIEEQCRLAVIEAGISQPGEMERLEEIIRPRVGIFTHLGDAHSENFESQEQKLREKARLFRRCEVVIGREGAVLDAIMQELPPAVRCLAWGMGEGADVRILSDRADAAGRSLELQWQGRPVTIQRTGSDRAPMREFSAFDSETGNAVPLTESTCGQTLIGVERSVYERSGFLSFRCMAISGDHALEARLNALVSSGEESFSYTQVEKRLRDQRNRLRHRKPRPLPLLPPLRPEPLWVSPQLRKLSRLLRKPHSLRLPLPTISLIWT